MLNTLPYERYILACVLNEPDTYWDVATVLEPKDFTYAVNGLIFAKIKELLEKGQELDIVTVYNGFSDKLKKVIDAADPIGNGLKYIEVLQNSPYSLQNLPENVKIIKSVSTRKKLSEIAGRLKERLDQGDKILDTNELIESCLTNIVDVAFTDDQIYRSGQIGDGLAEFIEERMKDPTPIVGHKTGFPKLDTVLGGLQESKLTVVVARAKVGKSTLLLNWAKFLAVDQKIPVLYLDTEMTSNEQRTRLLSMSSGVDEKKIVNGLFSKNASEYKKVMEILPSLEEAPLYHIYLPKFSLETLIAYARKYKLRYGVKVLFFDYIKMPESSDLRAAQEWQHLGYLTTGLKNQIAGQLDMAVITAGQMNRKDVGAPYFSTDQVAGSDRILHYANTLIGLRPKTYEEAQEEGGKRGNLVMTIIASRNTEDGISFDLSFKKPTLKMNEIGIRGANGSDYFGID